MRSSLNAFLRGQFHCNLPTRQMLLLHSSLFLTDEESGPRTRKALTGPGHTGSAPVVLAFKPQSSWLLHHSPHCIQTTSNPNSSPFQDTPNPANAGAALQWHPERSLCSCLAPIRQQKLRACHSSMQSLALAPPPHQSLCLAGPQASLDLALD